MPSSVIRWHQYNNRCKELLIGFVSGAKYLYKNVPASVYEAFMKAKSKGRFLNETIKSGYKFERVIDD
jgi:hypothetical protein